MLSQSHKSTAPSLHPRANRLRNRSCSQDLDYFPHSCAGVSCFTTYEGAINGSPKRRQRYTKYPKSSACSPKGDNVQPYFDIKQIIVPHTPVQRTKSTSIKRVVSPCVLAKLSPSDGSPIRSKWLADITVSKNNPPKRRLAKSRIAKSRSAKPTGVPVPRYYFVPCNINENKYLQKKTLSRNFERKNTLVLPRDLSDTSRRELRTRKENTSRIPRPSNSYLSIIFRAVSPNKTQYVHPQYLKATQGITKFPTIALKKLSRSQRRTRRQLTFSPSYPYNHLTKVLSSSSRPQPVHWLLGQSPPLQSLRLSPSLCKISHVQAPSRKHVTMAWPSTYLTDCCTMVQLLPSYLKHQRHHSSCVSPPLASNSDKDHPASLVTFTPIGVHEVALMSFQNRVKKFVGNILVDLCYSYYCHDIN